MSINTVHKGDDDNNKLTTIPNNKPDIIIRDNENGTCMLIDLQFQETEM